MDGDPGGDAEGGVREVVHAHELTANTGGRKADFRFSGPDRQ
jgi:hypothetical protein